jgi:uncharacterized protein YjbJ (UPF0337 family)
VAIKDKVQGKAEEIKGKVEQAVGKATESERMQARGKIDETKGRARGKVADIKDAVKLVTG